MSAPQLYPPDTGSRGREPFRGRAVPYHEQDATAHWARHYRNELTILALLRGATRQSTRIDLRRQLEVCRRKQVHWQRHANWDVQQATRLATEAKSSRTLSPASPASGPSSLATRPGSPGNGLG